MEDLVKSKLWISCFFFTLALISLESKACWGAGDEFQTPASFAEKVPQSSLADGIYLIHHEEPSDVGVLKPGPDEFSIVFDYSFLEEKPTDPPQILIIAKTPDVPLILSSEPGIGKDSMGKSLLSLSLSQEHVETLRIFTKSHIMSRIALIINGKVVSVNKIREEIKEGKVQINRCTNSFCEKLRIDLQQKVKK